MKNKKEELVRKVTRQGRRSLSINIPAEIVDALGIREKQKMVLRISGGKIIISDWPTSTR